MAILRCNRCGHLQEQPDGLLGETVPCPACENPSSVYGTLFFIGKLLDKYFDAQRTIKQLTAELNPTATPTSAPAVSPKPLDGIDFFNTDQLASALQHQPILDWFKQKQITVRADHRSVDTTGFFDEIATSIGKNLPVLNEVLERIRWAQQKDYTSTTIHLDKKSAEDARAIADFCRQLYDFSFVAKYFHNRKENVIRLVIQTAPAIRKFFSGDWLEWHTLMTCLHHARQGARRFSCARNLNIQLRNQESYELDVFMLIDEKQPVYIECKSGEFRQDIDKYQLLSKRLGIGGRNFIMCIAGLSDDHAKGLTAMYGLTFTNETGLAAQLAAAFQ